MTSRRVWIVLLALIAAAFISSAIAYPHMPPQMASHWNAEGQVNGYMPRSWGLLLTPSILAGLVLLFVLIPRIDPLKENIRQFRKYYDLFVVVFTLYFLAIHLWMILWNLGIPVSANLVMPVGIGILFFYLGVLLEKAKRNWFVGIRTPWTLSSDTVWDRTHRRGAALFKVAGLLAVIGMFFGRYALLFILVPALGIAMYLVAYSYFAYQREADENPAQPGTGEARH